MIRPRTRFLSPSFVAIWLFGACCGPAVSRAVVLRVDTLLDGNKFNLVEIEVTSGTGLGLPNRIVPYASLVGTTAVDFRSILENNATNTITLLGSPDLVAPADRLALLGDPHLNTGIFNPSAASPGLQVEFEQPVFNGPGEDFVVFELTIGSGQTPDPLAIRQLRGVGTVRNVLSTHYQVQGVIPGAATPNTFLATVENGGDVNLDELSTTTLTNNGAVGNPKWHVVPIDLTWLGVPEGGSVSAVEIASGDATRAADLLLVMGLPPAILPGDYDGNSQVEAADYEFWVQQFGNLGGSADGNRDSSVDAADYTIWRDNLSATATIAVTAIPEPTTSLLIGSAALALVVWRQL